MWFGFVLKISLSQSLPIVDWSLNGRKFGENFESLSGFGRESHRDEDSKEIYCNGFHQRVASNNSVNTGQHATIEEAAFSVDPTDAPIYWLDSDHVICVYCSSMSVTWLYI
jgi:hypothetical protein